MLSGIEICIVDDQVLTSQRRKRTPSCEPKQQDYPYNQVSVTFDHGFILLALFILHGFHALLQLLVFNRELLHVFIHFDNIFIKLFNLLYLPLLHLSEV